MHYLVELESDGVDCLPLFWHGFLDLGDTGGFA